MSDLLASAVALRDDIRSRASEIESARRLPDAIVDALTDAGAFRAGVPASIGGLEVDYPTQMRVMEELARADASVGWCAMIGAQTSITSALLVPDQAEVVFGDPRARAGGVFAPSGRAVIDGDMVRLSGRWAFGSGVAHSTWFALGAIVFDGDEPRFRDGRPDMRFVFVPTSQIEIEDTWDVSGLRGTGSNHVSANAVVVPEGRTFPLVGARPHHAGPLYRLPLFSALALGIAAVALGTARDALDELDGLAIGKTPTGGRKTLAQRAHIQMERARAEAELLSARAFVYSAIEEAWAGAEEGDDFSLGQRVKLRLAAAHAARTAARVVDRAYDAGGGTSIFSSSRLQRAFRDAHAMTQHLMVSPGTFELTGRVLLGVEADVSQL